MNLTALLSNLESSQLFILYLVGLGFIFILLAGVVFGVVVMSLKGVSVNLFNVLKTNESKKDG
jgi:hypothetical protein